jgi:hypothetical protein
MPRSASPLSSAKERARRAHKAAVEGDALAAAVYNRWWATALSAAAGMDDDVATEMFRRLAIMCDMRGWPAGIVQGVTARAARARLAAANSGASGPTMPSPPRPSVDS